MYTCHIHCILATDYLSIGMNTPKCNSGVCEFGLWATGEAVNNSLYVCGRHEVVHMPMSGYPNVILLPPILNSCRGSRSNLNSNCDKNYGTKEVVFKAIFF